MSKIVAVIAGVPGPIETSVHRALRQRLQPNFKVKFVGSSPKHDRKAFYSEEFASHVAAVAAKEVFDGDHPFSFCRSFRGACSKETKGKGACSKGPDAACQKNKPEHLLVLYQEGEHERRLFDAFHHSALMRRLERFVYGDGERTAARILEQVSEAEASFKKLAMMVNDRAPATLLPPKNFGAEHVHAMYNDVSHNGGELRPKALRQAFGKGNVFRSRDLEFKPAGVRVRHGEPGSQANPGVALSKFYRFGVQYDPTFHFDVSRERGRSFDGGTWFYCRGRAEEFRPRGCQHVNITVDDCER